MSFEQPEWGAAPSVAPTPDEIASLLQVEHLSKHYPVMRRGLFRRPRGDARAVDDVSFAIGSNETLGLVEGEVAAELLPSEHLCEFG